MASAARKTIELTVGLGDAQVTRGKKEARVISTPRPDLYLLRLGDRKTQKDALKPAERASTMLPKLGKAINKPGINRDKIFRGASGQVVYAYSVHPQDPALFVREDAQGNRTVGRLVNGRFRAE
jgi:hypothetical protein